jgi:hypothetical protein
MRVAAVLAVLLAVVPAASRADVAPEAAARYEAEARAAASPAPPETASEDAGDGSEAAATHRGLPRWGLALGAGFPDFATASLMYRPVSRVRLFAGPAWNYVAWGVQGGVAVVPWSWPVSPVLSLEAGKFKRSDLGTLASSDGEDAAKVKPLLARVDYAYAAVDVGVEIGSPRGFAFSLKVGLSWVSVGTRGAATYATDGGSTVTLRDPAFRGTLGSAKMGFHYWF